MEKKIQEIIEYIRLKGEQSRGSIKEQFSLSDDEYNLIKHKTNKLVSLRGRNGGFRLAPVNDNLPVVDIQAVNDAKDKQVAAEQRQEKASERAEKDFYPYVKMWAEGAGYSFVEIIGDNHRRGTWENPDVLAITVDHMKWLRGEEVSITSIEVKLNLDIKAIYQAVNYQRFSHEVYLAVFESKQDIRAKENGKGMPLYDLAVDHGIGIISMTKSGAGSKGIKCEEINSPVRNKPVSQELDSLLSDYEDLLSLKKRIGSPGSRMAKEMAKMS